MHLKLSFPWFCGLPLDMDELESLLPPNESGTALAKDLNILRKFQHTQNILDPFEYYSVCCCDLSLSRASYELVEAHI